MKARDIRLYGASLMERIADGAAAFDQKRVFHLSHGCSTQTKLPGCSGCVEVAARTSRYTHSASKFDGFGALRAKRVAASPLEE